VVNTQDLVLLTRNIGRPNMQTTNAPNCTNGRLVNEQSSPRQYETLPTQTTLTLTVMSSHTLAVHLEYVDGYISYLGAVIQLTDESMVTEVQLHEAVSGGFLNWHQEGDKLYLIIATAENTGLTHDTDVALIELAQGNSQGATLINQEILSVPKPAIYLPLIVK